MPLNRENQGLDLEEYKDKLKDGTYALRVGKEVPEGDVNLAYVHTPKVQVDENISLIDTSYTSDNVIPQDQMESMVIANQQGELEYVDLIGEGEAQTRPPETTFPSDKVYLTRQFKKNEMQVENALFYKFEIDYHYDSEVAIPNADGTYPIQKYTGQQIEITDENGNTLDDTYKYDIYVQAHALNPRIYSVVVYLNQNTDKTETFNIRYNHIDRVVIDEHIHSVKRRIEFYTKKDNTLILDNQSRQMLEGGKLRVINGVSAYEQKTEDEVQQALMNNEQEEIFAVVPKENGEGYKIVVSQRSEPDPRAPRIFSHRVIAEYEDYRGNTVKVSVGHITDWCINPEALLLEERKDYSGEWKNIGIPTEGGKLNARQMMELSLPFGTPSIPSDARYYIEDDKGNIMYHITQMEDNPNVDTQVNEVMSKAVEAKANDWDESPWKNGMQSNTIINNKPIPHRVSVIPERQITKWNFEWEANGEGYTERSTNYKTNWQVCADVGFKKFINPKTLDVLDKSKWSSIGGGGNTERWRYSYVSEIRRNVLEYLDNHTDITGFYQRNEIIDGESVNMMNKYDYEFSAKVKLNEPNDDDLIGLMFRVNNSQNYYMFAWESNNIQTNHGAGRIILDEYGLGTKHLNVGGSENSWRWTSNRNQYLNQIGFGDKHARLFKATPNDKPSSPNPNDLDTWNGSTRYPQDKTNAKFEDITEFNNSYKPKGWEHGKEYKITVSVTGNRFRVYINENANSREKGQLVCEGYDDTHEKGSYGIMVASQRSTYWYDLEMTEIEMATICTEKKEVVLTSTKERKLSNYTVPDMMEPLIDHKSRTEFDGAPYEIFGYEPKSDGEFTFRIDERTQFLYGKTNNPAAGGVLRTEWKTEDNGLTVKGTGRIEYHADGHYSIFTSPNKLPTEQVPDGVLEFQWKEPYITAGDEVDIHLEGIDNIQVSADVPPIQLIGRPYTLAEDEIVKSDTFKHLEYLLDTDGVEGFYDKLDIPPHIPKEEILLRLEKGRVTGLNPDGSAIVENPEHRVNYRFRCTKDGFTRLPVDQFQDQIGVNRLRLKSILDDRDEFQEGMQVDVVAWTTFEELEAVPLFAIKIEENRKIEIEKPKVEEKNMELSNWYLRVKNGRFLKRIALPYHELNSTEKVPEIYVSYPELLGMVERPNDIVEVDLEYSLPEYTNQEFHNRPYILMDKETPIVLNEYTIQTRYNPIVLESETGESFLEVYSIRGNQRRELRVSDVDAAKGIIYLHDRIREQDSVYIRYAYKEDWYTYRGYHYDEETFFHLDINPTRGHQHTVAKNGYHEWVPVDNNQEVFEVNEKKNTELLAKQMNIYLRPSMIREVNREDLSQHGRPIPGTKRDKVLFHTTEDWWFNPKDYKYDPTMLRLGKIMLQANSTIHENMTILDTRTKGGGLDESLSKEIIKQVNEESMYHWDIGYFDGEAYQENGVIILRLPKSILKTDDNPNGFHESEIQQVIAKHKGYGTLPIIEYYDERPDENRFNLLPNPEFLYEQHIGYYDPVRSKGDYSVRHMKLGSGDDYVLHLKGDAEYAITIPGYLFKSKKYRLDIKAMKEQVAPERSAGEIKIIYKSGEEEVIQMGNINREQWMVYKQNLELDPQFVHQVVITLNKTEQTRTGNIIYDYVMLLPEADISEETTEIHEI